MIEASARHTTSPHKVHNSGALRQTRSSTVLVVEDSELAARILVQLLSRLGFDVHRARDGREAVRAFRRNEYALVVMDCYMPEMDGWDATLAIRAHEEFTGGHVPIIGYSSCADQRSCLDAGMDDFLQKPASPDILARTICNWYSP
jgi:CheY-like chemotaxis protein